MRGPAAAIVGLAFLAACSGASSSTAGAVALEGTEEVVLVIGDFGSGSVAEMNVAIAMERVAADREAGWLLTLGDNFYTDDVDRIWNRPFGWVEERGMKVVGSLGNHDVETETRRELNRDVLGIEEPWRQVPIGDATLLVLDSNQIDAPAQLEFIDAAFESMSGRQVIAVFHHPAYSCSLHGPTQGIIESWVPRFQAGGVDLALSGHDHNYQRLEREGITYLVEGGSGQRLYQPEACEAGGDPPVASEYERNSFVILTIGRGFIVGEAMSADGELIDRFTIP